MIYQIMRDNHPKNIKYFLTLAVFFTAGILSVLTYQSFQNKYIKAESKLENLSPSPSPTPTTDWIPYPTATPVTTRYTGLSTKLTIAEVKKISADRTSAQTGEVVNYNATLKNIGNKKKFLTHICFNHSGGVTFGCLLNKNLEPNEEFNINNSMMYPKPGTYSAWITWSQDGVNFYRPQSGGSVTVTVE